MKNYILIVIILFTSCSTLKYGFLPGSDFEYHKPIVPINLKSKKLNFTFVDARKEIEKIDCSELKLDRNTELEGEIGLNYFKGYLNSMSKNAGAILQENNSSNYNVSLEAITFDLSGFGFAIPTGFAQISIKSPKLNKTYCTKLTEGDDDAPLKWYSFDTRKGIARKYTAATMRRVIEELLHDIEKL